LRRSPFSCGGILVAILELKGSEQIEAYGISYCLLKSRVLKIPGLCFRTCRFHFGEVSGWIPCTRASSVFELVLERVSRMTWTLKNEL